MSDVVFSGVPRAPPEFVQPTCFRSVPFIMVICFKHGVVYTTAIAIVTLLRTPLLPPPPHQQPYKSRSRGVNPGANTPSQIFFISLPNTLRTLTRASATISTGRVSMTQWHLEVWWSFVYMVPSFCLPIQPMCREGDDGDGCCMYSYTESPPAVLPLVKVVEPCLNLPAPMILCFRTCGRGR